MDVPQYQILDDFYPRSPCGERLTSVVSSTGTIGISIHALLAESDLDGAPPLTSRANFYPRSPCGERLKVVEPGLANKLFLSTLSLRRATGFCEGGVSFAKFLSTLSLRRATVTSSTVIVIFRNFYPRSPCGERRRPIFF